MEALDGVSSVNVNLSASTVAVEFDADRVNEGQLTAAIQEAGYEVKA